MLNKPHTYADLTSSTGRFQAAPLPPLEKISTRIPAEHTSEYPYVLISGSYKDDSENDALCALLGTSLARLQLGLLSGAGKAGQSVSNGLFKQLILDNRYDPDRIITYLRKKEDLSRTEVDTIGTIKFYGSRALELRKRMVFKSSVVVFIGGGEGTKQEEQLANIHNIPVIPFARSGGVAFDIWKANMSYPVNSVQRFDRGTFEALNSDSTQTAVNAAISLLKTALAL